jgi:plastocyanin
MMALFKKSWANSWFALFQPQKTLKEAKQTDSLLNPGAAIVLCLLVLSAVAFAWPHPPVAVSTVKGRIELTNSKLKPRDGRIDASGVVVWLAAPDGTVLRGASKQRKVITQRNKRFSPHIIAVETGSEVDFPNEDPFFHNVFSIFNGKRFDLGLYASGETRPVNFNRAGISYIFCNIHPQMSAVVIALDTPYFAVSDKAGGFAINNVPAGNYRLNVWHERAKPETLTALARAVQVSATGLDVSAITVSEEGYVPRPHPNKHGQDYDRQQPNYRKP